MSFLFSHTCSALHNLPGENSAWNHSTQQLNFSCWSITSPSFILPGQWKRNHFLHGTGAPLFFFFSLMLDLHLELTINKSLLNDNSSSVCSQRSHEREMMFPFPLKKRKKKNARKEEKYRKNTFAAGAKPQFTQCAAISLQAGFHSELVSWHQVWQKCTRCFPYALLLPAHALLSEGGSYAATPVLS